MGHEVAGAREDWYLQVLREGIKPVNEANTSRYVHEVLLHCLAWPFETILPQPSGRGFVDYVLALTNPPTRIHVEVKRLGARLHDDDIRKYIVRRGRSRSKFRVGALTNLARWRVFVAGRAVTEVAGAHMVCLKDFEIGSRADIACLHALISHRRAGDLKEVRAALAETDEVIGHLVTSNRRVLREVRAQLARIRDRHGLTAHVPQFAALRRYLRLLLKGARGAEDCPFSVAKLRQAVCAREVAGVANEQLVRRFEARNRVRHVYATVRRLFRAEPES